MIDLCTVLLYSSDVVRCVFAGLLWREHEAAVMYGSIDGGKNIATDPAFSELVRQST